jgi:uncharacterized lipoprotein
MWSYSRVFGVIGLAFTLMSCSHVYGEQGVLKNRENDYLKAQNIAPLQIPPGYGSSNIQSHYPVSEKQYTTSAARIDLAPPGLNTSGK